jgi:murein L,D-transpeptidase YcbB/YkuD
MCNPAIGLMAVAGATQAFGQYQQGKAENDLAQAQATQSRNEGKIALARGAKQSELIQDAASYEGKQQAVKTAEALASQRAAVAAAGLDPSSVTVSDIVSSSLSKAQLDEAAIRYNADMRSWATTEEAKYANWTGQRQGDLYSLAGKNAKTAGTMNAAGTLLGTAASIGMSGLLKGKTQTKFSPQGPSSGYAYAFRS